MFQGLFEWWFSSYSNLTSYYCIMGNVSLDTNQLQPQLPRSMRSLSKPIVYSPSLRLYASKLTLEELREQLSKVRQVPNRPETIANRLWVKFYQYGVYREFALCLQSVRLRLVLHLPILLTLFPSIRRLAQEVALHDRLSVESGEGLQSSEQMSLIRQFRSYREEFPRLTVFNQPAVL